jgi:GNAT superfamily N-acetyltransferase
VAESPIYRFYRRLKYPLPFRTWRKLPRLPSHKNEYWDGKVRLTPRPKTIDIYLDVSKWSPPPLLPKLFHSSFASQQPLCSWNEFAAARASKCVIEWTRLGRDGIVFRDACFVARSEQALDHVPEKLCGAAIVTLVPAPRLLDLLEVAAIPHPEDAAKSVVPHLDWLFVTQWMQRQRIGTLLLEAVVSSLKSVGIKWLASTCICDNIGSIQWHWRNGFVLPPRDPMGQIHRRKEPGS